MTRDPSQCDRILDALRHGGWMTTAAIHREAGFSRLNSRVSELRKRGHVIEHEHVPGKTGAKGSRYRWVGAPAPTAPEQLEFVAPSVPRTPDERFRLYARGKGRDLRLLATCATPEAVGVAVATLGAEGEFEGKAFGLLDTYGTDERTGTWIVNPWGGGL